MLDFAENDFRLNVKQKDGCSLREHLESAFRQTGRLPDELANAPSCPLAASYIWNYFLELNLARQNYGWGPVRFTYGELQAWATLRNVKLDAWEIDTLLAIDGKFIQVAAEARESDNNG